MSLGKTLKKVAKAGLRGSAAMITGGASEEKLAKGAIRGNAALITGGASELYSGFRNDSNTAEKNLRRYQQNQAQQNMEAFGYSSISDLIEAQKRKNADLEDRRKVTGIASLLGGNTTLG